MTINAQQVLPYIRPTISQLQSITGATVLELGCVGTNGAEDISDIEVAERRYASKMSAGQLQQKLTTVMTCSMHLCSFFSKIPPYNSY